MHLEGKNKTKFLTFFVYKNSMSRCSKRNVSYGTVPKKFTGWWLLPILYLFHLFQFHTFIITLIQHIRPSPFAEASLHFFVACCSEGKNLPECRAKVRTRACHMAGRRTTNWATLHFNLTELRCTLRELRCTLSELRCTLTKLRCTSTELHCTLTELRCTPTELCCTLSELRCTLTELRCTLAELPCP